MLQRILFSFLYAGFYLYVCTHFSVFEYDKTEKVDKLDWVFIIGISILVFGITYLCYPSMVLLLTT
ncbi:MAG: hypothetical protein JTJ21_06550 [Holdemanella sp.]|nr:hypothetical protein [Holdemanella sp.]